MSYAIIGVVIAAVAAGISAKAAHDQSKTNQKIANNNVNIAEAAAVDAKSRGEKNAQEAQRKARQIASMQRAAFSAKGVDISDGTAADVIEQTDFFGQSDAATARTNADKEAWNARAQKRGYEIQEASNNPNSAMYTSLLTSAGTVASKWYGSK